MKLYISLDMEGIGGTITWTQEQNERAIIRKYMLQQIEWLIQGIKESASNAHVEEIVVADSHSGGDSLLYDVTALDERLHLITGSPRSQYMMPDFGKEYDLVFLVGYHSGIGALRGVMDHTYTSAFHHIRIQDKPMSEALMNSAYAGYHSVPVGLVVGDEALRQELMQPDAMPWVQYVTTKRGLGRFAAKMRPMNVVRRETVEAVKKLLASDYKTLPLYRFQSPIRLQIELQSTAMADVAAKMPLVKRLDGRLIELVMDDYKELYDAREALGTLALSVR